MTASWSERVRAGSYALTGIAGYLLCVFCPPSLLALGALVLYLGWCFRDDVGALIAHVKPALGQAWRAVAGSSPQPLFDAPSSRRWPISIRGVGLALAALALLFVLSKCAPVLDALSRPFDWLTTSRDELRDQRDAALADKDLAVHERGVARVALDLAEETHHTERRVAAVVAQAKEDMTDAVTAQDFDTLAAAYGAAYERVWGGSIDPGGSDPTPVRPSGMLAAGASFVF